MNEETLFHQVRVKPAGERAAFLAAAAGGELFPLAIGLWVRIPILTELVRIGIVTHSDRVRTEAAGTKVATACLTAEEGS